MKFLEQFSSNDKERPFAHAPERRAWEAGWPFAPPTSSARFTFRKRGRHRASMTGRRCLATARISTREVQARSFPSRKRRLPRRRCPEPTAQLLCMLAHRALRQSTPPLIRHLTFSRRACARARCERNWRGATRGGLLQCGAASLFAKIRLQNSEGGRSVQPAVVSLWSRSPFLSGETGDTYGT